MLDRLTFETLEPHQGETFVIAVSDEDAVHLELVEAKKLGIREPQPWDNDEGRIARDPFTLTFRGPTTPPLGQGAYPMTHPEIGTLGEMFLIPIHENETGRYYEALFN